MTPDRGPATRLRDRAKALGCTCDIGVDYAYPHLYRIHITDGVNSLIGLWTGTDTIDVIEQANRALHAREQRGPA